MPRGDGTGPNGLGTMTGKKLGFCSGFTTPEMSNNFSNAGFGGRGYQGGCGNKRLRNRFFSVQTNDNNVVNSFSKENRLDHLKIRQNFLKNNLNELNQVIQELESQNEPKQ